MGNRLRRFVLPALVVALTALSVLFVLEARPAETPVAKPGPALGSPTIVFVLLAPADPQTVAVRLAGPGAVAYSYSQLCDMQALRPPRFVVPLPADQADAVLARAGRDPDLRDPVISVWPCGSGL